MPVFRTYMDIYINLETSRYFDIFTVLLTFVAFLVAYIAYVRSVDRDFESLRALLISFGKDLDYYEAWLGREGYSQETYKDKNSFCPVKPIYPLSNDSLAEILRRGVNDLRRASSNFSSRLSLFNERIIAFNSSLDQINWASTANPVLTEKLQEKLVDLGLRKTEDELSYESFKKSIEELKKDKLTEDLYYLAENIRRLNRETHVGLISNRNNSDKLNYLYTEIKNELDSILINFDRNKPWWVYYLPATITILSALFILTMYFFI